MKTYFPKVCSRIEKVFIAWYGEQSTTWAELLTEPDPETFVLLPVWLDSSEDRQPEKLLVS